MMYSALDLTLISATGLVNARELDAVYAVVSYSKSKKFKTSIHKMNGGSDPKWDYRMSFPVHKQQKLVVKIKAVKMFKDKKLGEVEVPVKELLDGVTSEDMQFISYELGHSNGVVNFAYKFVKDFVQYSSGSGCGTPCGTCLIIGDCGGGGGCGGGDGGGCGGCACGGGC